jgi:predicted DNA-binding WGR domain protein
MKRTFIYTGIKSGKFWIIETKETAFNLTFGKTGAVGRKSGKSFASKQECQKAIKKLIAEKIRIGYVEQGVSPDAVVKDVKQEKETKENLPYQFTEGVLTIKVDVSDKAKIEASLQTLVELMDNNEFTNKLYRAHPEWKFLDGNKEVRLFGEAFNHLELHPLLEKFGRKLIAANHNHCELTCESNGDQVAFGTNELAAMAWWNKEYIPLYTDLLRSIDLDNEVNESNEIGRIIGKWGWCVEMLPLLVARYFSLCGQAGNSDIIAALTNGGRDSLAADSLLCDTFLLNVAKELEDEYFGFEYEDNVGKLFEAAFTGIDDYETMATIFINLVRKGNIPSFQLLKEKLTDAGLDCEEDNPYEYEGQYKRKTILIYSSNINIRAKYHALLGDYFNIVVLKTTSHWRMLEKTLEKTNADCLILDELADNIDPRSFVQSISIPTIVILMFNDRKSRAYMETANATGLLNVGASSNKLLKLLDKAIGLPEIKNRRYFIFDKSQKYWSIEKENLSFLINYGKLGADGNKTEKRFASKADCQNEFEKLIAEKIKKGYVEKIDKSFINKD